MIRMLLEFPIWHHQYVLASHCLAIRLGNDSSLGWAMIRRWVGSWVGSLFRHCGRGVRDRRLRNLIGGGGRRCWGMIDDCPHAAPLRAINDSKSSPFRLRWTGVSQSLLYPPLSDFAGQVSPHPCSISAYRLIGAVSGSRRAA